MTVWLRTFTDSLAYVNSSRNTSMLFPNYAQMLVFLINIFVIPSEITCILFCVSVVTKPNKCIYMDLKKKCMRWLSSKFFKGGFHINHTNWRQKIFIPPGTLTWQQMFQCVNLFCLDSSFFFFFCSACLRFFPKSSSGALRTGLTRGMKAFCELPTCQFHCINAVAPGQTGWSGEVKRKKADRPG